MDKQSAEWTDFFTKVFDEVKRIINEQNKLEKDGSGPPEVLAIRKAVSEFPCPIDIAEIRVDLKKYNHIKDELCQIIRYDFSKLGNTPGLAKYYGIVNGNDTKSLRELLTKTFYLNDDGFNSFIKDFKTTAWCDDQPIFCTQFPLYNIKDNFNQFIFDFLTFPFSFFTQKIVTENKESVDWISKFNLEPDPILPFTEIVKMDEILNAFVPFSQGDAIQNLQQQISNIQLIPNVPEDVKKVFGHAKKLHLYAFFYYNFFTIAQHYAYLALESAIKNRYYQSFGTENALSNKKGETVRIGKLNHQNIIDFCRRTRGWNVHNLKINNEKFAFSQEDLLDWLVKNKIITLWEKRRCKHGLNLRNLMSHLTRPSVFPPGYSVRALEFVSDLINRLYSTTAIDAKEKSRDVFPLDFSPDL